MPSVQSHDGAQAAAAQSSMEEAFQRFKQSASKSDAREFQTTLLKDVHDAARDVERKLAAKGSARNFRRLLPLLEGLGHYSGAIEVLCNGTPYLPWIWVRIRRFASSRYRLTRGIRLRSNYSYRWVAALLYHTTRKVTAESLSYMLIRSLDCQRLRWCHREASARLR